ncbi:TOMM precursor leader peptide-binding protein [Micromonospora sp. NBC_01813]|uniref:TOMM precursor leader peptide-binding protein n=1 Tax=Micromonospora sp. NBC_01813 TaxID=2975988 RepID=UPI002DDA6EF9|nr:TOMM precursor leader peptide-binding protein [Micromonospora sp. NBC_01813]WSA07807.1 TOMM precursor leader peptide-binding protein [Micromonospora sp. NBC_01813]
MAAATFDDIAQTRPRVRRDVLYTQTPDGVLFHNSLGGFHLNGRSAYRLATLIVPYLNGDHRVADLGAALGAEQRTMVADLVGTLYECGFARDEPPATPTTDDAASAVTARFAPQIAYVDHYVGGAADRFTTFRDARVAVLGDDLVARWCVLSLVRNGSAGIGIAPGLDHPDNQFAEVRAEARALTDEGCPVDIEVVAATGTRYTWEQLAAYDVVVVTGGSAAARQTLDLLSERVPAGRQLLTAWTFGRRAVIGPHMTAGSTGCWLCAALRLAANGDPAAAADLWQGMSLPTARPGAAVGRPLAAMIGNLLGYEVFRALTGVLPAETSGNVIIQDLESLDVVTEPLLPHPACEFCSGDTVLDEPVTTDLAIPDTRVVEAQVEASELLAELTGRAVLIQPNVGVFAEFTDEQWTQTPLKVSTLRFSPGPGRTREVATFDLHTLAGARLAALRTAAVSYVDHGVPLPAAPAAPTRSVSVAQIVTCSGTVPATGPVVTATSLLTKEEFAVPAAAVRPFGEHNADRPVIATSAGAGAGTSPAEAAARGLLSALAYTRIIDAVRGRAEVAPVRLADADHPEIVFLRRSAANAGVEVTVLDLRGGRFGTSPVAIAYATDPRTGGVVWSAGSELTWNAAVVAAVRDLLGRVQLGRERGADVDLGDELVADFDPAVLAVTDAPAEAPDVTWDDVLDGVRAAGGDVLLIRTTPADLLAGGIHTARIVLTGGSPDAA